MKISQYHLVTKVRNRVTAVINTLVFGFDKEVERITDTILTGAERNAALSTLRARKMAQERIKNGEEVKTPKYKYYRKWARSEHMDDKYKWLAEIPEISNGYVNLADAKRFDKLIDKNLGVDFSPENRIDAYTEATVRRHTSQDKVYVEKPTQKPKTISHKSWVNLPKNISIEKTVGRAPIGHSYKCSDCHETEVERLGAICQKCYESDILSTLGDIKISKNRNYQYVKTPRIQDSLNKGGIHNDY